MRKKKIDADFSSSSLPCHHYVFFLLMLRYNCHGLQVYATENHAIIKKFSGVEISQLEDLISVFSKLSRGARVPLEYIRHNDRHRAKVCNA